ncbi:MAG: response regulator [Bacteroidia bacterium]
MIKHTVLLIDDSADLRENISELLELASYNVLVSEDGVKGLEMIKQHHPDLVLCDIMMPELDGFGVFKAIQNIPEMVNVPFIYISAKNEFTDLRDGMNLGADDYLIKPFTNSELLNVISSRLKKSEQIKEKFKNESTKLMALFNDKTTFRDIASSSQHKVNKKIPAKQMIYMEGDMVKNIFFLAKGKVKTFKTNEVGKEFIIEIYNEGDIFGYASFLENEQKESAMTLEQSEVIFFPKEEFLQILCSNNEMALKMMKSTSGYLLDAIDKMLKMAYNSSRKKVADALLYYYRKYKDSGKDNFPAVRSDLSALSCISKESVSRILTDFKNEGLIDIEPVSSNIKIQDCKKLEELRN